MQPLMMDMKVIATSTSFCSRIRGLIPLSTAMKGRTLSTRGLRGLLRMCRSICMPVGIIETRLAWMVHRLWVTSPVSRDASAASDRTGRACNWNLLSNTNTAESLMTNRWKGSWRGCRSVVFCHRISLRARVSDLNEGKVNTTGPNLTRKEGMSESEELSARIFSLLSSQRIFSERSPVSRVFCIVVRFALRFASYKPFLK
mmetsp:Transcript_14207/g.38784  ORF Transcript_14207/g.38784 Transcript_14207/m.38784 type:complete len:201 (-) Transcript_14207:112-714(-)